MFRKITTTGLMLALCGSASLAVAGPADFHNGTVFEDFGKIASVEADFIIPKRTRLKVSFDTAKQADEGEINRTLNSVARFINMHVEAGVPLKKIDVAVVIHGKATFDVSEMADKDNGSMAAVKALTEKGVRIIVCGQSAAYYDVKKDDLLPNVEMALSAMTAHAVLQQQGYTLNPF